MWRRLSGGISVMWTRGACVVMVRRCDRHGLGRLGLATMISAKLGLARVR